MEHPRKDCFKTFPLRFHFAIFPKPFFVDCRQHHLEFLFTTTTTTSKKHASSSVSVLKIALQQLEKTTTDVNRWCKSKSLQADSSSYSSTAPPPNHPPSFPIIVATPLLHLHSFPPFFFFFVTIFLFQKLSKILFSLSNLFFFAFPPLYSSATVSVWSPLYEATSTWVTRV